jgi:FKBP-type peptidyl-prolyl cis-trans isomerase
MEKKHFCSFCLYAICAIFFSVFLSSCLGDDPFEKQRQADASTIRNYVAAQKLKGAFTASGLYFDTISIDSFKRNSQKVTLTDVVEMSYKIYDLQGILLAKSDKYIVQPQVGTFFAGLSEGILLTREGQTSIFIVPSLLALGSNSTTIGSTVLPPNSCLRIEVKITDVRTSAEQDVLESRIIRNHIAKNNLTITKDSAGVIFVRQTTVPTGTSFKIGDQVSNIAYTGITIAYTGVASDDRQFDKGVLEFRPLEGYVKGFMAGITMMRAGETGYIYMISSLGYGAAGSSGKIAPYTPLRFEITGLTK